MPWRAPEEYEEFVPVKLHCTETETYVTAKSVEGKILLGKLLQPDSTLACIGLCGLCHSAQSTQSSSEYLNLLFEKNLGNQAARIC